MHTNINTRLHEYIPKSNTIKYYHSLYIRTALWDHYITYTQMRKRDELRAGRVQAGLGGETPLCAVVYLIGQDRVGQFL